MDKGPYPGITVVRSEDEEPFVLYKGEIFEKRITDKRLVPPLSDDFGRNLTNVDAAFEWCVNPHNWFESTLDIVRWEGLVPRIAGWRGRELARQPYDTGFPETILWLQRQRRIGKRTETAEE